VSAYLQCTLGDSIRVAPTKKAAVNVSIAGGLFILPHTHISMGLSGYQPPRLPRPTAPLALIRVRLLMPKSLNCWFFLAEAVPIANLPDDTHKNAMIFIVSGGSYLGRGVFRLTCRQGWGLQDV
jgi:hypothetical protein